MFMQHWPSSPLQPPESDMTLQVFRTEPKVREENLEGHVKFWGLQRTTWHLKLHETSQIMPQNWSEPKVRINSGLWCYWSREVSRHNQQSVIWVDYGQCCMHILSAKDYLWLVLHVKPVNEIFKKKWDFFYL